MTREEMLGICKEIVKAEASLNNAIDELLNAVGITHEEAKNGNFSKEIDVE